MYKVCIKCGIKKSISEFYKNKPSSLGVLGTCIPCFRQRAQKYRSIQSVEESEKVRRKKYNAEHRIQRIEYQRKYREKPKNKLDNIMGTVIRQSLDKGSKSKRHWESLVDFTTDQLKRHLERQFKAGMTWENYGKYGWHIDHKIPISAFNYECPEDLDFGKCWALRNLQPMWAEQNQAKCANVERPFQPSLTIRR
jgi:hypothetical protein